MDEEVDTDGFEDEERVVRTGRGGGGDNTDDGAAGEDTNVFFFPDAEVCVVFLDAEVCVDERQDFNA